MRLIGLFLLYTVLISWPVSATAANFGGGYMKQDSSGLFYLQILSSENNLTGYVLLISPDETQTVGYSTSRIGVSGIRAGEHFILKMDGTLADRSFEFDGSIGKESVAVNFPTPDGYVQRYVCQQVSDETWNKAVSAFEANAQSVVNAKRRLTDLYSRLADVSGAIVRNERSIEDNLNTIRQVNDRIAKDQETLNKARNVLAADEDKLAQAKDKENAALTTARKTNDTKDTMAYSSALCAETGIAMIVNADQNTLQRLEQDEASAKQSIQELQAENSTMSQKTEDLRSSEKALSNELKALQLSGNVILAQYSASVRWFNPSLSDAQAISIARMTLAASQREHVDARLVIAVLGAYSFFSPHAGKGLGSLNSQQKSLSSIVESLRHYLALHAKDTDQLSMALKEMPPPGMSSQVFVKRVETLYAALCGHTHESITSQANVTDDVGPYLAALEKIELERQQYNDKLNQLSLSDLAPNPGSGTNDRPQMNQFFSLARAIALKYAGLVRQVQQLSNMPGVPPSCKDLQGYYLSALAPFVSLATAASSTSGALNFLMQAATAQQEEQNRLSDAQNALQNVFTSHKAETDLPPAFQITDTEAPGGSGSSGSSLMGPAYHPGQ